MPLFQADRSGLNGAPIEYDRNAFNEGNATSKQNGRKQTKVDSKKNL